MLQQLIEWDKALFLFLNNTHTLFWDKFMWVYTAKETWIPLILSLLFILYYRKNWREATLVVLAIALTITLCDQFASSLCKPLFARFRPAQDPDFSPFVQIVNGYRGGRYGFISSHAANSFGAVVLLALIFRNRLFTYTGIVWAVVNCYSRIYLGVHYPGDILAGATAGLLFALIIYKVYGWARTQLIARQILPAETLPYAHDRGILIPSYVIYGSIFFIAFYAAI